MDDTWIQGKRPESSDLIRKTFNDRFFLETDGADVDIRDIYSKVAADLDIDDDELKIRLLNNYRNFFGKGK
jgi:hypothetical protein